MSRTLLRFCGTTFVETAVNSPRKHSRNARVISAEELGTMSKNNLRGITLDIGPILGIHSLTLIISCVGLLAIEVEYFFTCLKNSFVCVTVGPRVSESHINIFLEMLNREQRFYL